MSAKPPHRHRRIDHDLLEASPSTGARETAEAMHAIFGLGDHRPRVTCDAGEVDLKEFLGVSS